MNTYKEMIRRNGGDATIEKYSAIEVPDSVKRFRIFRIMGGIKQAFSNCWVIANAAGEVAVIDPGSEKTLKVVSDLINEKRWKIKLVLTTHHHGDHIGAAAKLANSENIAVHIHADGAPILKSGSRATGRVVVPNYFDIPEKIREIADEDQIFLGREKIEVLHTPGHTSDGCCIATDGCLFSGDTLLVGETEHTNSDTGSAEMMQRSLKKLLELPGRTIVHPGHGPDWTIAAARQFNFPV
ncbi:MAG: MBL fold metallo-hydrolase [Patescibacteria group bacterium]